MNPAKNATDKLLAVRAAALKIGLPESDLFVLAIVLAQAAQDTGVPVDTLGAMALSDRDGEMTADLRALVDCLREVDSQIKADPSLARIVKVVARIQA